MIIGDHNDFQKQWLLNNINRLKPCVIHNFALNLGMSKQINDLIGPIENFNCGENNNDKIVNITKKECSGCKRKKLNK